MKRAALEESMYAIWNDGDLARIDRAYEDELGHEIKRFVRENRELYPDIQVHIDDVIIKGDRFVTAWTVTGTHRDLNRPVTLSGVSIRTIRGGKVLDEKMFYDGKSVYDQLGFRVVPPEGLSPFEAMAARGPEHEPVPVETPDEPTPDEAVPDEAAPKGEDPPTETP